MKNLGLYVFEQFKEPDVPTPPMLKEDKFVDLHTFYEQYMYELIYRVQDLAAGRPIFVNFHTLDEKEE